MTKKKSVTDKTLADETQEALDTAIQDVHDTLGDEIEPVEVAASTMLGDLMKMTIELAKALPKSWQELSETQQDVWLNSVESQCRMAVRQVVQIIASEGCARIPVQIAATTIKKGVEVKVELVNHHDVIEMLSADTKVAMLVLANSDNFISDGGKPKAEKDQRSLDLGGEYTDKDGAGMPSTTGVKQEEVDPLYTQAVDFVVAAGKASISAVQRELQLGYNRAARLVELMETNGVVSPMDASGKRTVLEAAEA